MNLPLLQSAAHESQNSFLGWPMLAWSLIPFAVVIWLARSRKKRAPEPPHVNDQIFEDLVLRAERPTLVHFYRSWSIADRVMVNMAQRIAGTVAADADMFWLDVDANPDTMARYPGLETPAFVCFLRGKRIFHAEGVVDEADVVRETRMAIEREARLLARASDPFAGTTH